MALAVHFAAGLVSIVAGTIALSVTKGGRLHKQSGLVFTWAMVVLGLTAAGIGTYENRPGQVFGGLLAAYLVFTAMTTVKPLPGIGQRVNVALMVLAFAMAWRVCTGEWSMAGPDGESGYRPRVVPPLVIGTVIPLAALATCARLRGRSVTLMTARHLCDAAPSSRRVGSGADEAHP
jgi:hypothetical protein